MDRLILSMHGLFVLTHSVQTMDSFTTWVKNTISFAQNNSITLIKTILTFPPVYHFNCPPQLHQICSSFVANETVYCKSLPENFLSLLIWLPCFLYWCFHIFSLFQAPPKEVPKTIENQRIYDETTVNPEDEEVMCDLWILFHLLTASVDLILNLTWN